MCLTALGFWSSRVFCFAGSWGGGARVTKMARRGSGSAHTTTHYTTAKETLAHTLPPIIPTYLIYFVYIEARFIG